MSSNLPEGTSFQFIPEQVGIWLSETKPAFAGTSVPELAGRVAAAVAASRDVADTGAGNRVSVTFLVDFIAGREPGLHFVFSRRAVKEALAGAIGRPSHEIDRWLRRAQAVRPALNPSTPQAAPSDGDKATVPWHRWHERAPQACLTEHVRIGLERLARGEVERGVLAVFTPWCQPILHRQALDLLERGATPEAPFASSSAAVEQVLATVTREGHDNAPANERHLRDFPALLSRFGDLAVAAGWLKREGSAVRFACATFPALLIGDAIARNSNGCRAETRDKVSRNRAWAEAAWAAVSFGDSIDPWACQLVQAATASELVERLIVACAALGGVPVDTAYSDELGRAFRLCLAALIAFFPRRTRDKEPHAQTEDDDSPWYLPVETWQQCVRDLAHASGVFLSALDESVMASPSKNVSGLLGRLLAALALPERLAPEEADAVVTLAAPWQSAAHGRMAPAFFSTLFAAAGRLPSIASGPFLEMWMGSYGVPALLRADETHAMLILSDPQSWNPAGYLLNRPGLVQHWSQAWERLVEKGDPDLAVRPWVEAVLRLLHHNPIDAQANRLVLEAAHDRLTRLGMQEQAALALRQRLSPGIFSSRPDEAQTHVHAAILRLTDYAPTQWEEIITQWGVEPSLPWKALLFAGAPHRAIARWCIQKLREKQQAPPAYRDGPVGVLAIGGEVTRTDEWQIAFQQAEEALRWLLTAGDQRAVELLADACLHPSIESAVINPIMGTMPNVRLDVLLSQVFWGSVIFRRSGRAAFYSRVEQDQWLGDLHLLHPPYSGIGSQRELWFCLVDQALRSSFPNQTLDPFDATEGERLLHCYERALAREWIFEPQWPLWRARFEQESRPAPASFPAIYVMAGNPWETGRNDALLTAGIVAAASSLLGVDVGPVFVAVLHRTAEQNADAAPAFLGLALLQLLEHHPARTGELEPLLFSPKVIKLMRRDDTAAFWEALVTRFGADGAFSALDGIEPADAGLGLVDALLKVNRDILPSHELRPDLMRPLLVRSADGNYRPSDAFWAQAWKLPPEGGRLHGLEHLPPGVWLQALLVRSRFWPNDARLPLLRRLAGFSIHAETRRLCVDALLDSDSVQSERAP